MRALLNHLLGRPQVVVCAPSWELQALDRAAQGLSVARMMTARHAEPRCWLADGEPDPLVVLCEIDAVLDEAIRDVIELWSGGPGNGGVSLI
jgi:hypothetical protein